MSNDKGSCCVLVIGGRMVGRCRMMGYVISLVSYGR